MSKIIGRLVDFGIAKESTRGEGVLPTFWIPKATLSFDDRVLKARSVVNYGNINMEGNKALVARRHAQGAVDFDMMDQSFGLILESLVGGPVNTGPVVDSSYTHTYTLQDQSNQHTSLTIGIREQSIGDLNFRLGMIESMSITVTPDDVVKVSCTFQSRVSAISGAHSVSYTAENKFVGRHLTFKIENTTGDLAAGTNIPLRRIVINFEKNLRLIHNSGTVEPEDIVNQGLRITGEVELDYENRTYANLMKNGTYKAVRVQLQNTEATIGAGSTNPQFLMDLSRVDFDSWENVRPNDEIASQTFTFMALHDITNGNTINTLTLVNGHDGSSY